MNLILFFSLISMVSSACVNVQGSNAFMADFSDAGVEGFFQMTMQNGYANYEYKVDLSTLVTSCDLSQGLTYHVHTSWTDSASASTTTCGNAGGHYDPFLACGTSSEDKGSLCVQLNRTSSQGYTYPCSSALYLSGHHSNCEVGDFSGKFGRMMPSITNPMVFAGVSTDPMPPLDANYESADAVSKQWSSLVVHCPADNARLLCAHFFREKC
jgi:hypothetical protein